MNRKNIVIVISIFVAFALAFIFILTRPKTGQVENENITLNLAFGVKAGVYSGDLKNGLPDGHGSFTTRNKEGIEWTYVGEWKDGHMHGQGITTWENGQTGEGSHKNDYLEGAGRLVAESGEVKHEGEFTRGIPVGSESEYEEVVLQTVEKFKSEVDSAIYYWGKIDEEPFYKKEKSKENAKYYFREMQKTAIFISSYNIESVPKKYYPVYESMQRFGRDYQQAAIHFEKGTNNINQEDLDIGLKYLESSTNSIEEAFALKEKIDNGETVVETKQNPPTISLEEYNKLNEGMPYSSVVRIIGGHGEKQSEVGKKGEDFYTVSYSWKGEGSLGANAIIMFQGDKLVSKAQSGLE